LAFARESSACEQAAYGEAGLPLILGGVIALQ
jgi:hypothetical protein